MAMRKHSLPGKKGKKASRAGRGALLAMVGISAICLLALSALILQPSSLLSADYPGWWMSRGVVVTNSAATNDYAVANAGQVKWLASNAYVELQANLPGGAGSAVQSVVQGFSATNNYRAVNVGQLKNLTLPFYDRLIAEGYTNAYPWTSSSTDDLDYAAVNIGQVKQLFSFDLTLDEDSDGAPNWVERIVGTDSHDPDSDNDTMLDGYEIAYLGGTVLFQDPATNSGRLSLWTTNSGNWGILTSLGIKYLVGNDANAASSRKDWGTPATSIVVQTHYYLYPLDTGSQSPASMELRLNSNHVFRMSFGSAGNGQVATTTELLENGTTIQGSSRNFVGIFYALGGASYDVTINKMDGQMSYIVNYTTTGENPAQTSAGGTADGAGIDSLEVYQYGGYPARLQQGFGSVTVAKLGLDPLYAGDADGDIDGDGVTNKTEAAAGTSCLKSDTDGDGFPDAWELLHFGAAAAVNAAQPGASNDPDGDGLNNQSEYDHHTNPNRWDTDGDLICDGVEVTYSGFLNPTNSADGTQDHDSDGIVNREETLYGGLMGVANTDEDANGNDGAERTAGTYVNSANDLPGCAVSGLLTVADPVDREGDRPSERYRMLVWDVEYPETIFIRHEPMQSFAGTTNESRAYNQFRPYRWYQTRIEPLARENATNALDLDYMADVACGSAYFQVEKLDADLVLSTHEDCDTNWFTKSAEFRFVPRTVVDLDGVNSNGTEVADADELEPGVKLVDGYTKLRIQDPWQGSPPGGDFGTFTLSWTNVPGKWVKLNGQESPVTVPCASTGWPTNFTVTRSTNWVDWLDTAIVTLSHSVSADTDQVRVGLVTRPTLNAYRAGANFGVQVTAEEKATNDPARLVMLVNNDQDDNLAGGQRDNEDQVLNPGAEQDDDPVRIRLFRPQIVPDKGLLFVSLSDGYVARIFQNDGALLSTASVDMANPTGYLAGLATNAYVDIWLEGLESCRDLTVTYGYQGSDASLGQTDVIHMRLAQVRLTDEQGSDIDDLTILPREYLVDWGINENPLLAEFPDAFYRMHTDGLRADELEETRMYSQSVAGDYYDDSLAGGVPESLYLESERSGCLYHGVLLSESEKGQISTNRQVNVVHNEGGDYHIRTVKDTGKWKINGTVFRHLPLGTAVVASGNARWGVYVPTKWGGKLTVGCVSTSACVMTEFKRFRPGPDGTVNSVTWSNGLDVGYNKQGMFTFAVSGGEYTVTNIFIQEAQAKRKVQDDQGQWHEETYAPWNFWFFPKVDSNSLDNVGDNLFDIPGALTKFDTNFGPTCQSYAWESNTNFGHHKIWVPGVPYLLDDGHCMDAAMASSVMMQPDPTNLTNNAVGFSQEDLEGLCTEFFTKAKYQVPDAGTDRQCLTRAKPPVYGHSGAYGMLSAETEAENDRVIDLVYDAIIKSLGDQRRPLVIDFRGRPPASSGWNQACYKFSAYLEQDPDAPSDRVSEAARIVRFTMTLWANEDDFPSSGEPSTGMRRLERTQFRLIFGPWSSGVVMPNQSLLNLRQDWQSVEILEDRWGVCNPPIDGFAFGNIGHLTDATYRHFQSGKWGQNYFVTFERLRTLGMTNNVNLYQWSAQ